MKKTPLILLLALTGCAGMLSIKPISPRQMYAVTAGADLRKDGEKVKAFKVGDSVVAIGEMGNYWQAVSGNDTGVVDKEEFKTEAQILAAAEDQKYAAAITAQPLEFTVPLADEQEVWARAQYFLNKHGDMKIQSATDFLIQTYNPSEGRTGYTVSRLPSKTEVRFSVDASHKTASWFLNAGERALQNARVLAYFMRTGEIRTNFLY